MHSIDERNISASLVFGHTAQLPNCFCRERLMRTASSAQKKKNKVVYVEHLCKRRFYCIYVRASVRVCVPLFVYVLYARLLVS